MVDRTDLGDIPDGLVRKRLLSPMMELLHVPYPKHLMCRKEDAYSHCAVWEFTLFVSTGYSSNARTQVCTRSKKPLLGETYRGFLTESAVPLAERLGRLCPLWPIERKPVPVV